MLSLTPLNRRLSPLRTSIVLVIAASILTCGPGLAQPANLVTAVSDPGRPAVDTYRDDRRKPLETLAFAGVRPGMTIAELIPGTGYYTRILAKAVGPQGRVYALPFGEPRAPASRALAADPAYGNITLAADAGPAGFKLPAPVDMVWTSLNYHDVRAGRGALNAAAFAALKPGGSYLIIDQSAVAGAGEDVLLSLHRIDEAMVKREVLAAGFVLEAESDHLRNPADNRRSMVFDREVNRAADQFVLRFRKPGGPPAPVIAAVAPARTAQARPLASAETRLASEIERSDAQAYLLRLELGTVKRQLAAALAKCGAACAPTPTPAPPSR